MNQKVVGFIQKRWIIILIAITLVGGFFRMYHFSDWMHYELDQARDYKVISAAIEKGPLELPLQGPKAAGNVLIDSDGDGVREDKTTLRLGPLFYYIEYVSALVFGNTPAGSVALILLLSILTIPLFYFFNREYFSVVLSMALTLLFSSSLFFIVYSRFGWNPNLMPFFALATGYCLLRLSRSPIPQNAGWWLVGASVSFAFLSNMHFLAFSIFPVVCTVYLCIVRPRIPLVFWALALGIFIFLSIPLIINDVKTGGENVRAFIASVGGGDTEEVSGKTMLLKNVFAHTEMVWVVLTGEQTITVPRVHKSGRISCEGECKDTSLMTLATILVVTSCIASLVYLLRREKLSASRHFLILIGLWLGFTLLIYTPLAFDFAPRFFLLHGVLFIVLFGLMVHIVCLRGSRRNISIIFVLFFFLLFSNLIAVRDYFTGLVQSEDHEVLFTLQHDDKVLGEKTRVMKGQLERVVDVIMKDYEVNSESVYLEAQPEYKRALWERVEVRSQYIPQGVGDLRTPYRSGNYYFVMRRQSSFDKNFGKFVGMYDVVDTRFFGTLVLYTLQVKDEIRDDPFIEDTAIFEKRESPQFSSSAQVRYLWRQVLLGCVYSYESKTCE